MAFGQCSVTPFELCFLRKSGRRGVVMALPASLLAYLSLLPPELGEPVHEFQGNLEMKSQR